MGRRSYAQAVHGRERRLRQGFYRALNGATANVAEKSPDLIDQTLAYVATSRPRCDAQIYTDNEEQLSRALMRRHDNATALAPEQIASYALAV